MGRSERVERERGGFLWIGGSMDGRIAGIADGVGLELTSVYWLLWRLNF